MPDLVAAVSQRHGLGPDAAALYLILLGMPDPTDRNTARWTGWRPARLKAARAELAGTDLVVAATRSRAGRSLFLPGGWAELRSPQLPLETWKLPMLEALGGQSAPLGVLVPVEPPRRSTAGPGSACSTAICRVSRSCGRRAAGVADQLRPHPDHVDFS